MMARARPLDVRQILDWADAHYARTGQYPDVTCGAVADAPREKWINIDGSLRKGGRGLPCGLSLARLLDELRGKRNIQALPRQRVENHRRRRGRWRKRRNHDSLRIQMTFDESQMDDEEPNQEAVDEFDRELRSHLAGKYEIAYLEVLDDSPYSNLLGQWEDSPTRKYPERKQRELTDDEKERLRARIEQADADIFALALEFACSASQVAGIKAAMNR